MHLPRGKRFLLHNIMANRRYMLREGGVELNATLPLRDILPNLQFLRADVVTVLHIHAVYSLCYVPLRVLEDD